MRNGKSLKDHLVQEAVLPPVNAEDWSKPRGGERPSCEASKSLSDTNVCPILKEDAPTRRLIYDHLFEILVILFIYLNVNNVNIAFIM